MGIQDRDYYREDYAKKNGLRYSAKKAIYSNGEKLFSEAVRPTVRPSTSFVRSYFPGLFQPSPWRLLLQIVFTVAVCVLVFGVLKMVLLFIR